MGYRDVSDLDTPLKIGKGTDTTEIRVNGTQRLTGDATSWRDMILSLIGKKLTATNGRVDYDFDEMCIKFQDNGSTSNPNDFVGGNMEINHDLMVGTQVIFKPHIHWFQEVVGGVAQECDLTMLWRIQNNDNAKTTIWNEVECNTGVGGDDIFDFTSEADGIYNQISRFPDMIVDCGISDTFQIKLVRTDSNGGDMLVYFFDLHGKVDSFGSDEEIMKIN